jgi:glycogen phosphorylase
VKVELYANAYADVPMAQQALERVSPLIGTAGGYAYRGRVVANRPASDFTPRITPHNKGVTVPLEVNHILWQH